MKNKIKSIFYIITLSFLSCTLNAGEWVNMFDGKTLDGWKVNTENPKTFSVVDGTIKVFGPRAHMFYGKDGNAKASAYSSSKAGVIALTKSLGKELANKNIAVNAVTPAGAKTRILNQMSKEHVKRMLSKVPRARFLKLNELSSMVCWLSSEENSFSTAAVFDISGGRSTY